MGFYFCSWKTRWAALLGGFLLLSAGFPLSIHPSPHPHLQMGVLLFTRSFNSLRKSPPPCWLPGAALEFHIFHFSVQWSVSFSTQQQQGQPSALCPCCCCLSDGKGNERFYLGLVAMWDFPCRETHSNQPKHTQERLLWLLLAQQIPAPAHGGCHVSIRGSLIMKGTK